ncbi:DUF1858 domain-containing protein [Aerococcaceae bacterium DSM 111022]|nr:DUF1858 domain-containing protein [Aerococcaceae bacterium DSM 111022]
MKNEIDLSIPVNETLKKNPEILDVLVEIGFKPLKNPAMRESVGRLITLNKGCDMINIPVSQLVQELEWNGYTVKGVRE